MANGFNPYSFIGGKQTALESLLQSQQVEQESTFDVGQQKGVMKKEFQRETDIAMEKAFNELKAQADAAARKKRKRKGKFGSLIGGLISMAMPGLGHALTSLFTGHQAYKGLKEDKSHQLQNVLRARAASKIDQSRWGKTFLSEDAKSYEKQMKDTIDAHKAKIEATYGDKSDMRTSALKTGAAQGLASVVGGKAIKGIFGGGKRFVKSHFRKAGIKVKDAKNLRKTAISNKIPVKEAEYIQRLSKQETFASIKQNLDVGKFAKKLTKKEFELLSKMDSAQIKTVFGNKTRSFWGAADKAYIQGAKGPFRRAIEDVKETFTGDYARESQKFFGKDSSTFLDNYLKAMAGLSGADFLYDWSKREER